jgi:hypothetical protein
MLVSGTSVFLSPPCETEHAMKLLDLLAHLGLWPFDSGMHNVEADEGARYKDMSAGRPIVVPRELRPVVQAARWPTEYARRTMH